MIYPKSKNEITSAILAEIGDDDPDNPWKNIPVDKLVFSWWVTGRSGPSLRLSDEGFAAFEYAKIEKYEFPYTIPAGSATLSGSFDALLVSLNKKLKCPYFLGVKLLDNKQKQLYIAIYDHKIGVMLSLFGNLQEYLESVGRRV